MSVPSSVVLLLVPLAALAQTGSVVHADRSRGVTLAPTSAAFADEATALTVNPAGLTFIGDTQLIFAHERSAARAQSATGLFLGDTLFEALGAGFSLEWVRTEGLPSHRKTRYGLSLGAANLALGATYNLFSSSGDPDLDGLGSFDLGLAARPTRALSFGLVGRNLDAPARGAVALAREYDLGIGVRPFGERVSVGVDYLFGDGTLTAGRLTYTGRAEVFRGGWLGAGFSHGLRPGDEAFFQLSFTLDASHLGATYAAASAPAGLSHLVQLRASSQAYRGVQLSQGKIALFDLDDLLAESTSPAMSLLGATRADPYLRLTRMLDGAARDPDLRGVVLKLSAIEGGLGKAEELRKAVLRLREAGKKVVAVLLTVSDAEYLVASAADRVYSVPQGMLLVDGFAASATFLGGSMDKLGVKWDVARVGAYKNAPDALTRREMSAEQRESIDALLDAGVRAFEGAVTQSRALSAEALRAAVDEGLKSPRRAKELGLIDDVLTPEQLDEKVRELFPGARLERRYRPRDAKDLRWGARPKIAIVPVLGDIAGGKSRSDPLGLARIAGAETIIGALRRASEDSSVAAIVLRVDSPGGDGLASDLIYRAVAEAAKKKPVIASMGDVAASGGYYAAMAAHEIFAEPTTITGSIGVFLLKPAVEGLATKLGANQQTLQRGKLAGILSGYRPWTEEERASAQRWIDSFYDDFITEVARSRKMTKEQVDAVARGRVWSGEDAQKRGLVDRAGGLLEAIEAARKRAGIPDGEEVDLAITGEARGLLSSPGGEEGVLARMVDGAAPPAGPPEGLRRLAAELGIDQAVLSAPGVRAQMEYRLEVR